MENTVKCWVGRGLLGGGCNSGGSVRFLKLNSVASLKRIGKKKKKKTIAATLSSAFEVKRLWVSESDTSDLPLEAFVTGAYILLSSTQKLQCHQFPFYLHFTLTQYLLICHTDTHTRISFRFIYHRVGKTLNMISYLRKKNNPNNKWRVSNPCIAVMLRVLKKSKQSAV